MEKILNLTQHLATPEQIAQGVVDLSEQDRKALVSAITFEELPDVAIIENRAKRVCDIAVKYGIEKVMIGGAPFFMSTLEKALKSGAKIIGVNNRDLKTFTVDCKNSIRLRNMAPEDVVFVSESGIRTAQDIHLLAENRVDAVLIGETLMRSENKKAMLETLNGGALV